MFNNKLIQSKDIFHDAEELYIEISEKYRHVQ